MSDNAYAGQYRILEVDRLVHEPARYNIMALLYVVEQADFLFVRNQTQLTAGNLSSHLSKLEEAGYLDIRKEFVGKTPRTFLTLTAIGRRAFDDYRSKMKSLFSPSQAATDTAGED